MWKTTICIDCLKYMYKPTIALLFPLSIALTVFDLMAIPQLGISVYAALQFGILFLMVIASLVRRNRGVSIITPTLLWLLAFLFWSLISLLNVEGYVQVSRTFQVARLAIMSTIVAHFLGKYWKLRFMDIFVQVIYWIGVIGALTIITDFVGLIDFASLFQREAVERSFGILGQLNYAAGTLSICLPFFFYYFFTIRKRNGDASVLIHAVFILFIFLAIGITGSRSGYIRLFITTIIVILYERRHLLHRRRLLFSLGFSALLITGIVSSNNPLAVQFRHILVSRGVSLADFMLGGQDVLGKSLLRRKEFLISGWEMFKDHPLLGIGLGNFRYVIHDYSFFLEREFLAHNTYLEVLTGTGFIGFALLVGLLLRIFRNLYVFWRQQSDSIYFYLLLSFANVLMLWAFMTNFSNRFLWSVFIPLSIFLDQVLSRTKYCNSPYRKTGPTSHQWQG